jgi:hypothetical protein
MCDLERKNKKNKKYFQSFNLLNFQRYIGNVIAQLRNVPISNSDILLSAARHLFRFQFLLIFL